jgi:molybdopterin-guanine dinucleotide biosynthesis protein A
MLSAIIVAGGSSQRMGFDKLFAAIAGEPVIAHAIRAFERATSVSEIVVVAREQCMMKSEQSLQMQDSKESAQLSPAANVARILFGLA